MWSFTYFPSKLETDTMSANAYSNWNTGIKSGLVALPGHNISFYASGADRSPGEPAVIIIPGLASSITGWAAVSTFPTTQSPRSQACSVSDGGAFVSRYIL